MNTLPNTPSLSPVGLNDVLEVVAVAAASISRKLPSSLSREDLESVGKLAVARAVQTFRGTPDQARASCYVRARGAMLDEIRKAIPWSRGEVARVRGVRRVLHAHEGPDASLRPEIVAAALGISVKAASRAIEIVKHESDVIPDLEGFADESAPSPADSTERGDIGSTLMLALDLLVPSQRRVLILYYLEEQTLAEIARGMALTEQRVHQLRNAGIEHLRKYCASLGLWQTLIEKRGC